MNKKVCTTLALSLILAACGGSGGGGGGTPPITTPDKGMMSNKDGKLDIQGDNNTATIIYTKKTKINVSGDNNMVYAQSAVESLDVVGDGNTFDISNGVTVDSCNIVGDNNKAVKSEGIKINCSILGKNNTGFN
jgi:hypothetical protein